MGVCRGRQGGQRAGAVGTAWRRWRQYAGRIARTAGVRKIERLAGAASAGSADRRFARDRKLTAAERTRGAGGIRILAGIEGIAAAPALRLRRSRRLLDDRRGCGDLLVVTRLPVGLIRLRRRRSDIGLHAGGCPPGAPGAPP